MTRRPDVTLTQLRYFVEAATHGSMTRAAAELHVAQSAVSAAVAELERQIGTQVFIRQHARGLVLTAAGTELHRDAQGLLGHVDEVLDAARGRGERVSGRLRMACFLTLAPFVLPALLAEVATRHPDLEIEVLETEAASVSAALRGGSAEMAVSYDLGLGPDVQRLAVASAPPHVVLHPEHPLAASEGVALAQLSGQDMVLLDLPHSRDYFMGLLHAAGAEPVVRHRSSSYETVRGLVAAGRGFSVLNQRPAHEGTYSGGRVVMRPVTDAVPALSVVLARLAAGRPTARASAVATCARTVLQRLAVGDPAA